MGGDDADRADQLTVVRLGSDWGGAIAVQGESGGAIAPVSDARDWDGSNPTGRRGSGVRLIGTR